jgi:hypothetical protein
MTTPEHDQSRLAGGLLIAAALLSVLVMSHHPSTSGHGLAALKGLASIGPQAAVVHGMMLVLLLAQVIGQAGLATRLGWHRLVVQGAFLAQLAGALAIAGAAVINGFALATLAQRMVDAGFTAPGQYKPGLWALFAQAKGWEQASTGAWAIALLLWGLAVWPRRRWLGLAALPLALVPAAGGLGLLPLNVIGYGAVVVSQAVWMVCAGVLLLRQRL